MPASRATAGSPRVYRLVGHSGTGKTTLIERLIPELARRGLRVAVVKDSHHRIDLDQPGKDTWRFRAAGAGLVILSTDEQVTLFERRSGRASLQELVAVVAGRADIVLAEGYRDAEQPAVLVWRSAVGRAVPEHRGPIVAVVSDEPLDLPAPAFGFEQLSALADHLLSLPLSPRTRPTARRASAGSGRRRESPG